MSVRRTILIELYAFLPHKPDELWWCAREYVQHGDESRTHTVLFTAPTRDEVADWYAQYLRERREPKPAASITPCNNKAPHTAHLLSDYNVCLGIKR